MYERMRKRTLSITHDDCKQPWSHSTRTERLIKRGTICDVSTVVPDFIKSALQFQCAFHAHGNIKSSLWVASAYTVHSF